MPADDIPTGAPAHDLPAEGADTGTLAESAARPEADSTPAAGLPGLVESVAQLPQAAVALDSGQPPGERSDAILPPAAMAEGGPQARGRADAVWSRAPKLQLTPDMTALASFRIIVSGSLSHLRANHECARLNLHVEGVHQCRIALRRLRSAFKTYAPVLDRDRIRSVAEAVGWIAKILGTARDLDVLQTELVAPAAEALGQSGNLDALTTLVESRKQAAYGDVNQALTSVQYGELLDALRELGDARPVVAQGVCASPDRSVTELAKPALSAAHRKLLKSGDGFESLSEAERHEVRIALKRLRYTLEFFATLFEGGSKKKYIKRLARLQDDLGRMNDIAAAQRTLARLLGLTGDEGRPAGHEGSPVALAFAAGGVLGWHRREAARTDGRLIKDWYAFVQTMPFWAR